MNRHERALMIGLSTGASALLVVVLVARAWQVPADWRVLTLAALLALTVTARSAFAAAPVDASEATPAPAPGSEGTTPGHTTVTYDGRRDRYVWYPPCEMAAGRVMLMLGGHDLRRQLVLAAESFARGGARLRSGDVLEVIDDDGSRFLACVRRPEETGDAEAAAWLITVHDRGEVGREGVSTTTGDPRVTRPALIVGRVTYERRRGGCQATFDDVQPQDAELVADCIRAAWLQVAENAGVTMDGTVVATAKLRWDATWDATLHVPVTGAPACELIDEVEELLHVLHVPVALDVQHQGLEDDIDE